MAETTKVVAKMRDRAGKGGARSSRREGLIPAVIYGDKQPPMMIAVEPKSIERDLHREGYFNHTLSIDVDGTAHTVLPRYVQLDPVTDKVFVTTVAASLVVGGYLSILDVVLLSTREIGEIPLVVWLAVNRDARSRRADHPKANLPGKLATALQFGVATAALFRMPHLAWVIDATAGVGVLAAASYWAREMRTTAAG